MIGEHKEKILRVAVNAGVPEIGIRIADACETDT
jgi:hypothetical protein